MTIETRTVADITTGTQHRDLIGTLTRADDQGDDGPDFTGIAVPYDTEIELWPGLRESVAAGAIDSDDAKLFYRHREIIGRYDHTDATAGYGIAGHISDTSLGRDAKTLVRDGALDKLSIGFTPIEWTETHDADTDTITIRHTKIRLREVSLVPHPAYDTATITDHRSNKENHPMPTDAPAITRADLDGLATDLADLKRSVATIDLNARPPAPETRSAGALLRAAAQGDDTAVDALNRAYSGGTTALDYGHDTWVKDLAELIEQPDELAGVFGTAPLPDTGMTLEFGRLKDNTVKVEKQAAQGDTIVTGNLSVESATVPVETYAGGTSLTIQTVKRAQAPLLDMHLKALALAAGQRSAKAKLDKLNALVTDNLAADHATTLAAGGGWVPWVRSIVGAVKLLRPLGLGLGGLLLTEADWYTVAEFEDADGRPMLATDSGDTTVGSFNVTTLDGKLLTIPTRMVLSLTGSAFFNKAAITQYTSPAVKLTNTEVFTLSEDFAVYQFGAVADEVPGAIVPVKAGA